MSGEVVIVSTGVAAGLAATLGAVAVGGIAWGLIRQWQEQQHLLALQRSRVEKRRLQAWQGFQAAQRQGMQHLAEVRQQTRRQLAGLRLRQTGVNGDAEGGPQSPALRAQGFLHSDERSQAGQRLRQLDAAFAAWPPALARHPASPLPALRAQLQRWQAQLDGPAPPPLETVQGFADTALQRLEQFGASLQRQQQLLAQTLQATETLLDDLLETRALNQDPRRGEELDSLHAHLERFLQRGQVDPADLALLQTQFAALRQGVQADFDQAALQVTLRARVAHHLHALGYTPLGENEDTWQIPGGERVRFSLQADQRLSFQVQHERDRHSDAPMSLAEQAFLRQQEGRWCKDLHRLIDGLNADGFAYQAQFERELPEASIPIVVLESAEDLLQDEAQHRRDTPRTRTLP